MNEETDLVFLFSAFLPVYSHSPSQGGDTLLTKMQQTTKKVPGLRDFLATPLPQILTLSLHVAFLKL